MVTIEKAFDCLQMKDEIQARILSDEAGLTDDEIQARRRERILADPVLGRWFENLVSTQADASTPTPASPKP